MPTCNPQGFSLILKEWLAVHGRSSTRFNRKGVVYEQPFKFMESMLMSLYIKTEDYREHGVSKYSDLELIRAIVQKELNMERVFVSFVNKHEYIRVDFLAPRPQRTPRRRRYPAKSAEKSRQA